MSFRVVFVHSVSVFLTMQVCVCLCVRARVCVCMLSFPVYPQCPHAKAKGRRWWPSKLHITHFLAEKLSIAVDRLIDSYSRQTHSLTGGFLISLSIFHHIHVKRLKNIYSRKEFKKEESLKMAHTKFSFHTFNMCGNLSFMWKFHI